MCVMELKLLQDYEQISPPSLGFKIIRAIERCWVDGFHLQHLSIRCSNLADNTNSVNVLFLVVDFFYCISCVISVSKQAAACSYPGPLQS